MSTGTGGYRKYINTVDRWMLQVDECCREVEKQMSIVDRLALQTGGIEQKLDEYCRQEEAVDTRGCGYEYRRIPKAFDYC